MAFFAGIADYYFQLYRFFPLVTDPMDEAQGKEKVLNTIHLL
jgi:hypothetical protein